MDHFLFLTCALIIALFLSCSAFSTTNLALSASCAATCLASIAAVNSFPKVRLVMDTSSRAMLKLAALSVNILRISLLTAYKEHTNCSELSNLKFLSNPNNLFFHSYYTKLKYRKQEPDSWWELLMWLMIEFISLIIGEGQKRCTEEILTINHYSSDGKNWELEEELEY